MGCVPFDDFKQAEKVGEGTFGIVHKASHRKTGRLVALKRILMRPEQEGFPITALREIKLLKLVCHPSVMSMAEIAVAPTTGSGEGDDGGIYMVFDFMDHDLTGLLESPEVSFGAAQVKLYMKQLLSGLAYLHSVDILHRDIKGANLLISNAHELKIADFGLARPVEPGRVHYTPGVVTRWYRPPELLLGATKYGPAVDMWGAGCILGEMITKRPLLPGDSDLHQLELIVRLCGSIGEETMHGCSSLPDWSKVRLPACRRRIAETFPTGTLDQRLAASLIDSLLQLDPARRLTAKEALEHDFFKSGCRPALPSDLPIYASKFEYTMHQQRQEKELQQQKAAAVGHDRDQRRSRQRHAFYDAPNPTPGTHGHDSREDLRDGNTLDVPPPPPPPPPSEPKPGDKYTGKAPACKDDRDRDRDRDRSRDEPRRVDRSRDSRSKVGPSEKTGVDASSKPRVDEPKIDKPKFDAPRSDASRFDAPRSEAPRSIAEPPCSDDRRSGSTDQYTRERSSRPSIDDRLTRPPTSGYPPPSHRNDSRHPEDYRREPGHGDRSRDYLRDYSRDQRRDYPPYPEQRRDYPPAHPSRDYPPVALPPRLPYGQPHPPPAPQYAIPQYQAAHEDLVMPYYSQEDVQYQYEQPYDERYVHLEGYSPAAPYDQRQRLRQVYTDYDSERAPRMPHSHRPDMPLPLGRKRTILTYEDQIAAGMLGDSIDYGLNDVVSDPKRHQSDPPTNRSNPATRSSSRQPSATSSPRQRISTYVTDPESGEIHE